MQTINQMLVMDVDGVITNLKDKKANPQMLRHIYKELINATPVALNTGRSLDAVVEKVINPLTKNKADKSFLKNLIVVGEKGGTWMTFDEKGVSYDHVDKTISISKVLQNEIKNLVQTQYADSMFYDTPKKTMISTEMKDGYDMNKYAQDQSLLTSQVDKIIRKYSLEKGLVKDSNPIALDVQHKYVGKHLGVRRILNWLRERKIKVLNFATIGDMQSDIKMAEELHKNNFSVTHIHVGEKKLQGQHPFEIITTANQYENGALEFLKNF